MNEITSAPVSMVKRVSLVKRVRRAPVSPVGLGTPVSLIKGVSLVKQA